MKPNKITLHHSTTADGETFSWAAIRDYHIKVNGWKDIGYHFGIEKIGPHYEIVIGRMLNEQGSHCLGFNPDNIGICFVGNFDKNPVPEEQFDLGVRLVVALAECLDIPTSRILGDREFHLSKTCPGKNFKLNRFRFAVGVRLS